MLFQNLRNTVVVCSCLLVGWQAVYKEQATLKVISVGSPGTGTGIYRLQLFLWSQCPINVDSLLNVRKNLSGQSGNSDCPGTFPTESSNPIAWYCMLYCIVRFRIKSYGIAWYCIVGFGARAVSRKTPIYFIENVEISQIEWQTASMWNCPFRLQTKAVQDDYRRHEEGPPLPSPIVILFHNLDLQTVWSNLILLSSSHPRLASHCCVPGSSSALR